MCIQVHHKRSQPANSDFRQISSKVYIDTCFPHVRKFQYFWRVQASRLSKQERTKQVHTKTTQLVSTTNNTTKQSTNKAVNQSICKEIAKYRKKEIAKTINKRNGKSERLTHRNIERKEHNKYKTTSETISGDSISWRFPGVPASVQGVLMKSSGILWICAPCGVLLAFPEILRVILGLLRVFAADVRSFAPIIGAKPKATRNVLL